MEKIEFIKNGYDPQIDYIKGLCILFVICTHSLNRDVLGHILFPYWGDTAVPIFLIIQVFHYYKKGINTGRPSVSKLWTRIMKPFIAMLALMFLIQYFIYFDRTNGSFSPTLYWDKRGPGSYYIFIYIEFAFIIPMFAPLFTRLSTKWAFFFFVVLSQLLESTSCITHCPDYIYRILFFRYTFLIFIGYLLARGIIYINMITLIGGVIGIVSLFLFNYTDIDLEPLFYTSLSNWKYCHWICYLYIAFIFLWILRYSYLKLNKSILKCIEKIGRYSYEIYLFQIVYFATFYLFVDDALNVINYYTINRFLYVAISITICVVPVIILKSRKTTSLRKHDLGESNK